MKIYKIKIHPYSPFATYPKGDMLYGFFLYWWSKKWANKENYSIEDLKGKVIFSDFFPTGYLPKPNLPLIPDLFGLPSSEVEEFRNLKKEIKRVSWVPIDQLDQLGELFLNRKRLIKLGDLKLTKKRGVTQVAINRFNSTASGGGFDPYLVEMVEFLTDVDLFVGIEEVGEINLNNVIEVLTIAGESGFGKKSSTGRGWFKIKEVVKVEGKLGMGGNGKELSPKGARKQEGKKKTGNKDSNPKGKKSHFSNKPDKLNQPAGNFQSKVYGLALSPFFISSQTEEYKRVPIEKIYYSLFTRFGKFHGSSKPFKNPVVMMDTGSVIGFQNSSLELLPQAVGRIEKNSIETDKRVSYIQARTLLYFFQLGGKLGEKGGKG